MQHNQEKIRNRIESDKYSSLKSPYIDTTIKYLKNKNINEIDKLEYFNDILFNLEYTIIYDKKNINNVSSDLKNLNYIVNELEKILNLYKEEDCENYYDFTYPFRYKIMIKNDYEKYDKNYILKYSLNIQEKIDKKKKQLYNNIKFMNKWVYQKSFLIKQNKNLYKQFYTMSRNM